MAESSDDSLLEFELNQVSKSPKQLTCKLYYGINRKATIIASTKQRNGKKHRLAFGKQTNEKLYFTDHDALDAAIKNENPENNFEKSQETFPEGKAEVPNREYSEQYQKSVVEVNDLKLQAIQSIQTNLSPVTATNLHRVFYTYEPEQIPHLAFVLPRLRQEQGVCYDPEDYVFPTFQDMEEVAQYTQAISTDETLLPEMHRRTKILVDDLKEKLDLVQRQRRREDYSAVGSQLSINLAMPHTYANRSHLILAVTILATITFCTIWAFFKEI